MIICAGNNETFDFAQPMGVGLIETSMNLTRACLFDNQNFYFLLGVLEAMEMQNYLIL